MRIVLALDESPSSIEALDLVASLPWPSGTSLTVLTALDGPASWLAGIAPANDRERLAAEDTVQRSVDARLAALCGPLEERGWTIDRRAVRGRAAGAIVAAADQLDADLIALGSRGLGTIETMLLGSVSAEVVERATCSVLVARHPKASRLLVATDGSDLAAAMPTVLARWQVFSGLSAIALSVTPVDSSAFELMVRLYTMGGLSLEPARAELEERHRRHATEMAESLSAIGIPTRAETRAGDAAREIIAAVAEHGADLVVTGSHGLRGLDRWLLGSVARNVLIHTPASVLVVRDRGRSGT